MIRPTVANSLGLTRSLQVPGFYLLASRVALQSRFMEQTAAV